MANLIHLDSIGIQLGPRKLFHDLKLVVPERARIGIVGPNGSGKSTLLKIVAGLLEVDSGRVIRGSGARVSYVPQMESFDQEETVLEAVLRKIASVVTGHEAEVLAAKFLTRSGFSDLNQSVTELSGGWRKRLSLSAALAEEPDLLLLDEPTNHLDYAGLSWLENLLAGANFGWILISHDRYFLEKTVNRVFEISSVYPEGFFQSEGGYFDFKQNKEEFLAAEAKRTSSLANRARRELEWASRSPKARTGKASYRMKEASRLKKELKAAKSRKPQEQKRVSFQSSERGTKELVELIKCSFSFGEHAVIKDLNYPLVNGICLGLLGSNGQGKSTLLKLIGGELSPTSGKVKRVSGLKIVYFDQLRESLTTWKKLGELLGEGHDHVMYHGKSVHIIGWGRRFGFEAEDHEKPVATLSGGEQARALLSILVRQEADLLLLDEPTNDLDILMLEALETMILEFSGAVVLVTHDRYMLDEVCTHFLGFSRAQELRDYSSCDQWLASLRGESSPLRDQKKEPSPKKAVTKLTYNDQREYQKMESKIQNAEKRFAELETQAMDPAVHADREQSLKISEALAAAKQQVEQLYERWEELDALKRELEGST